MEALILEKLHKIEQRENCRILLAVESGSRAWGFAPRIVITMCGLSMSAIKKAISS